MDGRGHLSHTQPLGVTLSFSVHQENHFNESAANLCHLITRYTQILAEPRAKIISGLVKMTGTRREEAVLDNLESRISMAPNAVEDSDNSNAAGVAFFGMNSHLALSYTT